MKLIDVKDTLPVGFIPIQETVDTRESALSVLALGGSRLLPSSVWASLWKYVRAFPVDGEGSLPFVIATLVLCVSEECGPLPASKQSLRLMPPGSRAEQ